MGCSCSLGIRLYNALRFAVRDRGGGIEVFCFDQDGRLPYREGYIKGYMQHGPVNFSFFSLSS